MWWIIADVYSHSLKDIFIINLIFSWITWWWRSWSAGSCVWNRGRERTHWTTSNLTRIYSRCLMKTGWYAYGSSDASLSASFSTLPPSSPAWRISVDSQVRQNHRNPATPRYSCTDCTPSVSIPSLKSSCRDTYQDFYRDLQSHEGGPSQK